MLNLKETLELAGKCCLAWLDPNKDMMPTKGWEVSHDVGRWWDAMLRLEAATGFVIPNEVENVMMKNLQKLLNNKHCLLLNSPEIEWMKDSVWLNVINLREGMLALNALVRYRDSEWARDAGHRMLEAINTHLQSDGLINVAQLSLDLGIRTYRNPDHVPTPMPESLLDTTVTTGRALEAIVWFYEATKDPLALNVAERIAKHSLANTVNTDGTGKENIFSSMIHSGHNHSYLGTLRGLLLYGFLTGYKEYIDAVEATYRKSVFKNNITWSGWTSHCLDKTLFHDKEGDPIGEHASCGDVAQIALWLAIDAGSTDLLDDVERLIRARLLPSQVTDDSNPRQLGGWGTYSDHFGQSDVIFDVLAAVTHSLIDIYQHIITRENNNTLNINMHFDIETPWADVLVTREEKGYISIKPKIEAKLRIRVPGWAKDRELVLKSSGKPIPLSWVGQYLEVEAKDAPVGKIIELQYELPQYKTVEVTKVSGRKFCLTWRGDEVIACEPEVPIYRKNR